MDQTSPAPLQQFDPHHPQDLIQFCCKLRTFRAFGVGYAAVRIPRLEFVWSSTWVFHCSCKTNVVCTLPPTTDFGVELGRGFFCQAQEEPPPVTGASTLCYDYRILVVSLSLHARRFCRSRLGRPWTSADRLLCIQVPKRRRPRKRAAIRLWRQPGTFLCTKSLVGVPLSERIFLALFQQGMRASSLFLPTGS